MINTSEFASSSPKSLLINLSFWLFHKWLFVVLFVSVLAFYYLFPLTYPKSDELFANLSVLIHGFALWGLGLAIVILTKIQVEHAFALQVEKNAQDKLMKIRSKEIDRLALEGVGDILPNNPTPNLAMPRLFQHIIGEARDHRFESSMSTMQPYREEAIDDIFKLQNIQKIALQLGILGTFIGLILALSQLNLDSSSTTLELKSLFNSLHISFSTSVAGLEVAVILGLLIMVVRLKQEAYFQTMEKAADTMISLAQNAIPDDYFFNNFEQIKNAVSQLDERVYAQTEEVAVQTKEMRNGIEKLVNTKAQFQAFLNQIQNSQAQLMTGIQNSQKEFVKEMMTVYDRFSPKTITTELQQSLEMAVEKISKTFHENLKPSLEKITAMNKAIHEVHSVLQALENNLKEQNQQLEKVNKELLSAKSTLSSSTEPLIKAQKEFIESAVTQLEKGNKELTQSKTDFYDSLQPLIASQNRTFDNFQRDVKNMSKKVETLNKELETSNEVVKDLVQLITSRKPLYKIIFEKLKMFYRSFKS
ncbi:MAG: MotA/TolQ/ExbB proton channel family protein [Candidatus Parabeggiatoa sp.]|nr:MotA/TolQ/ExbB proton channel family protein [Candidatus Parabeggiatoa sp.]